MEKRSKYQLRPLTAMRAVKAVMALNAMEGMAVRVARAERRRDGRLFQLRLRLAIHTPSLSHLKVRFKQPVPTLSVFPLECREEHKRALSQRRWNVNGPQHLRLR